MKEKIFVVVKLFFFRLHIPLSNAGLEKAEFSTCLSSVPVVSRVEFLGEDGLLRQREWIGEKIIDIELESSLFNTKGLKAKSASKIAAGSVPNSKLSVSISYYILLPMLLKLGAVPSHIAFYYTEILPTPIALKFFFHIPLILSGVIIFLIILGTDPEDRGDPTGRIISRLPCSIFSGSGSQKDCSICLEGFFTGEKTRTLPCSHFFHKECIDTWLRNGLLCPLCRAEITPERRNKRNHRLYAVYAAM